MSKGAYRCPTCDTVLVRKTSRKPGANCGKDFFVCNKDRHFRWADSVIDAYEEDSFCVADEEEGEDSDE